ncbi:hypothetical protein QYF36_020736 [Acer negundo]|nr:hypothetical protein QYF36_020736 [Acer negundo]
MDRNARPNQCEIDRDGSGLTEDVSHLILKAMDGAANNQSSLKKQTSRGSERLRCNRLEPKLREECDDAVGLIKLKEGLGVKR